MSIYKTENWSEDGKDTFTPTTGQVKIFTNIDMSVNSLFTSLEFLTSSLRQFNPNQLHMDIRIHHLIELYLTAAIKRYASLSINNTSLWKNFIQ